jgi:DNA-binding winged helix-turn-helix (wHTH) protein
VNDQAAAGRAISFGHFHLLPEQRLLLEGDKPVRLGSRAFEILTALVERAGKVVGKDELIARAWPGLSVEEGNLRFQIAGLRRALGDGHDGNRYITAALGRGYSFVAPVAVTEGPSTPAVPAAAEPAHNLPIILTRMVGRTETVAALAKRLPGQRLITIVGPGGVGKTAVALAVAERLIGTYAHGV